MRKFLGFAAVMISMPLYAQGNVKTVSGRITDGANGTPLAQVAVFVPGGFQYTQTDLTGRFSLQVRGESGQIGFQLLGYYTDTLRFSPWPTDTIRLELKPFPVMAGEFEIRAVRAERDVPVATTTLNRADIERVNLGRDLPMLLDQTPSVVVHSDAGAGVGYTGMRIRGTDATRTNVTINGIPINDAESQGVFWVNMPDLASSIASVQIQRGVGTSTHGAGAFGATINIQTNELRDKPFAMVSSSAGSFNTFRNTVEAGTGLLPGNFTIDARLSKITSDGFIDRAWSDMRSYFLSAGWYGKKTNIRFNAFSGAERTYQAWYGVPQETFKLNPRFNSAGTDFGQRETPYENEIDNYQQDHYQLFINHRFSSTLSLNVAAFYTRGRGYYEQFRVNDALSDYGISPLVNGADTISNSDLIRRLWLDNHLIGGIYSLNYLRGGWDITLGGGGNHYIGGHFGNVIWASTQAEFLPERRYYDLPAGKTDINQYLKVNKAILPGLTVFADVQYRRVDYTIEGFPFNPGIQVDETFHFLNPKAGVSYRLGNAHRWYAYYGIANREPNRVDFETPDAQRPTHETLRDLEVGYAYTRPRVRFSANGYWMDYVNQLVLTGQINEVGAYTRTNAARSYRLGIEIEGGWKPLRWFELAGNLALSRNRIADFSEFVYDYDTDEQVEISHGETDIAFSPGMVGGLSLIATPFRGFEASLVSKYVGRQFLDNTSNADRALDAFFVQELQLRYARSLGKGIQGAITLGVYNLWDVIYAPNGYTFSYRAGGEQFTENFVYPMAGRHFLAGIQLRFGGR